jgi:urocanate hydratase
MMVYNYSSK